MPPGAHAPSARAARLAGLRCIRCGRLRPADLRTTCGACGGILEVVAEPAGTPQAPFRSLRDLAAVLPLAPGTVTLGEGATPLLPLDRLAAPGALLAKLEGANPTGSFKDRGAAVAVGWARELGAAHVVAASTGNNAAAVAAYAARAGLPCSLLVPSGTADAKVAQALVAGAALVEVEGTFSDCHRVAAAVADAEGTWANLTSTYASPFMTEAHKSVAYELVDALGDAPGSVVIPLGAGPLLAGVIKGFEELHEAGRVSAVPVPVGVQAAACAPIVRAFERGTAEVVAWHAPAETAAASIADPLVGYPDHGTRTLELLRRHDGVALPVDEDGITDALQALAAREGVVSEPAAAATLAAVRAGPDLPAPCVLLLTGHGLKDPVALAAAAGAPRRRVPADVGPEQLRGLIAGGGAGR